MIPCATLPARPSLLSVLSSSLSARDRNVVCKGFYSSSLLFSSLLFSLVSEEKILVDFDERQKHFDVEVESAQRIRVSFSSLQ